ncbi:hypothetical protein CLU79DRAFT_692670 [Phycomyces nitens]|nr:hypothetical protein CLU79DRAFT_692670 [Phycomyces nitens]
MASTISTTATTTTIAAGIPSDGGFTEFKLDPFLVSEARTAPAPHRLREARRSFVFYLQPSLGSPLQKSLAKFQEHSYGSLGPNQAHNTPPHIGLLSRVEIERGPDFATKWNAVDNFVKIIDEEVAHYRDVLVPPQFAGYDIPERPSRSLMMRLLPGSGWHKLLGAIEHRMQGKCVAQPMDRLLLAYNVLQSIPRPTLHRLRDMAKQDIDVDSWVLTGGDWQLCLYEVMVESGVVGVQHQMSQIRAWRLGPPHERNSMCLVPTSVRVKWSIFMARYMPPDHA